jgi:penicillin-binding protein 2
MRRDTERHRQFTRRALLVAGGQGLLLAALCGRLYQLQVLESERYTTLADDNRIDLRLSVPPRGRILDRFGRTLAGNRQDYRVLLIAEQTSDVSTTLGLLGRLIEVRDSDRDRVLREIGRSRKFIPVTVRDSLSWEDVARVEVNTLDLPGVTVDEGFTRVYPYGPMLAHILGYVAPVAETDIVDDPILRLPDIRIGKGGIERVHEAALRGIGGSAAVEVNAVGRPIRELSRTDGRPGRDVRLTIDLDLQRLAYERLGDESGAVVTMDVLTGEVLALVSSPGFDPNLFAGGIPVSAWRDLNRNPKAPLLNKAIAGQYAPGSTFKQFVALAALERGTITPATTVVCRGALTVGGNTFHCWKRRGHGAVQLRGALSHSCDVYFYEIARRTGIDRISAMAGRFGFGQRTGIDLPHERAGLMPTEAWKEKVFKKPWTPGESLICGIGQGYVLATPLQLAVSTARIASGLAVVPRLAFPVDGDAEAPLLPAAPRLDVSPQHLKLIRDGMVAVVTQGTAARSAIRQAGFEMAGKTGTSQVRRITMAERRKGVIRNEDLPWEKRDHALFVGYAPVTAPRYAVAVIVEHGGGGSKVAAPIARDVLLELHRLGQARSFPPGEPGRPLPPRLPGST